MFLSFPVCFPDDRAKAVRCHLRVVTQTDAAYRAPLDALGAIRIAPTQITLDRLPLLAVLAALHLYPGRCEAAALLTLGAADTLVLINIYNSRLRVDTHRLILLGACLIAGMIRALHAWHGAVYQGMGIQIYLNAGIGTACIALVAQSAHDLTGDTSCT